MFSNEVTLSLQPLLLQMGASHGQAHGKRRPETRHTEPQRAAKRTVIYS